MITVQTNIERESANFPIAQPQEKKKKLKIVTGEITSVGRKKKEREKQKQRFEKKVKLRGQRYKDTQEERE